MINAQNNGKNNESKDEKDGFFFLRVNIIMTVIIFLTTLMTKTIAIRLMSMIFIAFGFDNKTISLMLCCSERTVRDLRKKLKALPFNELISLLKINTGMGRPSKVSPENQSKIIELVDTFYCNTLLQIKVLVKEKLNLDVSRYILSRILEKFGCKKRVIKSFPAKADPLIQRKFYDDVLKPLIDKCKTGAEKLLFVDATHCLLSFRFVGSVYGTFRRIVKTFTGKHRYNVLGALDYQSKDLITINSKENVTSKTVIDLLIEIGLKYYNKRISIILDNARYQHCKAVTNAAYQLGIDLIFLPPYSPNLNFIERVWKFLKAKLHERYYDDFDKFTDAIDGLIPKLNQEYKSNISTLVQENVEMFDDLIQILDGTYKKSSKKDAA